MLLSKTPMYIGNATAASDRPYREFIFEGVSVKTTIVIPIATDSEEMLAKNAKDVITKL